MLGDFYYDFGLVGVVAGGFVCGTGCFWLYRRTLRELEPDRKALLILMQVQVCMYANRGALMGIVTNNLVSIAMVVIPYVVLTEFWKMQRSVPANASVPAVHNATP